MGEQHWEAAGFSALERAQWERQGFGPEEARDWCRAGFPAYQAREWDDEEFTPEEATEWFQKNVDPATAAYLSEQGIPPSHVDVSSSASRRVYHVSVVRTVVSHYRVEIPEARFIGGSAVESVLLDAVSKDTARAYDEEIADEVVSVYSHLNV